MNIPNATFMGDAHRKKGFVEMEALLLFFLKQLFFAQIKHTN